MHCRKLLELAGPGVVSHAPSPGTGEQAARVDPVPLWLSQVLATLALGDLPVAWATFQCSVACETCEEGWQVVSIPFYRKGK